MVLCARRSKNMIRKRRDAPASRSSKRPDRHRCRQSFLMVCRSRGWLRRASQKSKPIRILVKNAPFNDEDEGSKMSDSSSERLRKIIGTMGRRRSGGKLILHLLRNKTAEKIPYSAWLDMLDDLRLWVPSLTLRTLTSSDLATLTLVVKHTDVIKLRPNCSEVNLVSLIWHLRKFPTGAGFKCSIVFG